MGDIANLPPPSTERGCQDGDSSPPLGRNAFLCGDFDEAARVLHAAWSFAQVTLIRDICRPIGRISRISRISQSLKSLEDRRLHETPELASALTAVEITPALHAGPSARPASASATWRVRAGALGRTLGRFEHGQPLELLPALRGDTGGWRERE